MLEKRKILFALFVFLVSSYICAHKLSALHASKKSHRDKMPFESESESRSWYSFKADCKARHNILLLKTHKTGSSTVQNILLRYADEHDLSLALPTKNNYFGHPELFNRSMLFFNKIFSINSTVPPVTIYNIFAFHARLNYQEMKAAMPSNTIFITVLREPVKLMESMIIYYNLPRANRVGSPILFMERFFAATPNTSKYHATYTDRLNKRYGRNQMSYDLGLQIDNFDDTEKVTDFIKSIDSQFHLVMIAERMDESLILLKHLLCWTLEDIVAFPQNTRLNTTMSKISSDLEQRMRHYNKADQLLYEYFSAKLDRQVEEFGVEKMKREVASLRDATHSMFEQCVRQTVSKNLNFDRTYVRTKVDVVRYQLKAGASKTCKLLAIDELSYLPELREKQGEYIVTPSTTTEKLADLAQIRKMLREDNASN